jgi:hypothetical protein
MTRLAACGARSLIVRDAEAAGGLVAHRERVGVLEAERGDERDAVRLGEVAADLREHDAGSGGTSCAS